MSSTQWPYILFYKLASLTTGNHSEMWFDLYFQGLLWARPHDKESYSWFQGIFPTPCEILYLHQFSREKTWDWENIFPRLTNYRGMDPRLKSRSIWLPSLVMPSLRHYLRCLSVLNVAVFIYAKKSPQDRNWKYSSKHVNVSCSLYSCLFVWEWGIKPVAQPHNLSQGRDR